MRNYSEEIRLTFENAMKLLNIGYNLGLEDNVSEQKHKPDLQAFAEQAFESGLVEQQTKNLIKGDR